jgi:hypothetical protein
LEVVAALWPKAKNRLPRTAGTLASSDSTTLLHPPQPLEWAKARFDPREGNSFGTQVIGCPSGRLSTIRINLVIRRVAKESPFDAVCVN